MVTILQFAKIHHFPASFCQNMQLFFITPVIFNIFRAHTIPIAISDEVTASIVDRGAAMMATASIGCVQSIGCRYYSICPSTHLRAGG